MATVRWFPRAVKRAQVITITITGYDVTTTYSLTIGSAKVSTLGTGGTPATTAAALAVLLQQSQNGEFQEVAWTNTTGSADVVGTAVTWGKPFTAVSSVSGGAGTIAAVVVTTSNSSPNDLANVLNYSTGSLPANGDVLLFDYGGRDQSAWWNLDALTGVLLDTVIRRRTFTGDLALPEINRDSTPYTEYRVTEFTFGMQGKFLITLEQPGSDRAEQIKLNSKATQTNVNIIGDSPGQLYGEACWWRGTHPSNVVNVRNGSLAILPNSGNATGYTAVVSALNADNSTVRCGDGVTTLTTITGLNSTFEMNATFTTLTLTGGVALVKNSAAATTITVDKAGRIVDLSDGTFTTLTLGNGCQYDRSIDQRTKVITNKVSMYQGSAFLDPNGTTIPVSFQTVKCGNEDVRVVLGQGHSYAVTA